MGQDCRPPGPYEGRPDVLPVTCPSTGADARVAINPAGRMAAWAEPGKLVPVNEARKAKDARMARGRFPHTKDVTCSIITRWNSSGAAVS